MIWLLLIAVVAFLVYAMIQSGRKQQPDETSPEVVLRVSVETVPSPTAAATPALQPVSGNILQPYSPIRLTVVGASPDQIGALRTILADQRTYRRDRQERILGWFLTTNARIKEIDTFIAEWGPKYRAAVKVLCEADSDWASASELDRRDIEDGARRKAFAELEVRVADFDYNAIAEPPRLPAEADDAMLSRFGFDSLSFYFQNAGDLDHVHVVPSDDWSRARFEELVAKGLARRGADVTPAGVLETLTLKEMEALVEDLEHHRFTRRAPAIEFLTALQDLRDPHQTIG